MSAISFAIKNKLLEMVQILLAVDAKLVEEDFNIEHKYRNKFINQFNKKTRYIINNTNI
jgi:hypothetical protein